jgi:hypothetical protein
VSAPFSGHLYKTIKKNSELYLGFIDLDRIPRGKVWECLEKKGIDPQLITATKSLSDHRVWQNFH